ncbi:MAG: M28 family peptidase, partial [Planctomycetota bacterium]
MKIIHSRDIPRRTPAPGPDDVSALLQTIAASQLRAWVERIAVPRDYSGQPAQNAATAAWLADEFAAMGYTVARQGQYNNIVAHHEGVSGPVVLVGAHYDSVAETPGADDNGSAVAALLGCAEACSRWPQPLPLVFVAFNLEERCYAGSTDFVESWLPHAPFRVECAHILEMVGMASSAPGSQRVPTGLPIDLGDVGDFLGLLADDRSSAAMEAIVQLAVDRIPDLPVSALCVPAGAERAFPVLARSDHVPFWTRGIPALLWTDTAEFRNPHYHLATDLPDTLDYDFMRRVTQVLTAFVVS